MSNLEHFQNTEDTEWFAFKYNIIGDCSCCLKRKVSKFNKST